MVSVVHSLTFWDGLCKYVSIPYSFGIFWTSFWASFCYKRRKNGQDQFGIWPTREKSTYVHVQWQHVTNPTSTWALIISNPPSLPTRTLGQEIKRGGGPSLSVHSMKLPSFQWYRHFIWMGKIHEISSAFATILLRTHLASTLNWNY